MNIDNLTADQFETSMALIGDVAQEVMTGPLGSKVKEAFTAYRDGAKKAKEAAGDDEKAAEAAVTSLAMDMLGELLPELLHQGTEVSYKLLAALDGQTLDEYKACFTVKKYVADIKDAVAATGELKDVLAPFFA